MSPAPCLAVSAFSACVLLAGASTAASPEAVETPEDHKLVLVSALGGGGVALERSLADAPYGGASLVLEVDPADIGLYVGGSFRWYRHRQDYTVRGGMVANTIRFTEESPFEHWIDARLTVAYDVLHTFTDLEFLQIRIGVAPRYDQFLADGFDYWLFAPEPFGMVRWDITDEVDIDGSFGFAPAVVGAEDHRSVFGMPKFIYDFSVGMTVDLTGSRLLSLELRWQGHAIMYELTERWYQGALAGLRVGI